MELSDLTVFKTVAEEGGITAAASKLHRVPSNVTARIQKLEQELGTPLFLREGNRLKISAAGQHLLGYADNILNLAQEAIDGLNDTTPEGVLKLGSIEMAAATRLVEPLMVYHREFPEVNIEVSTNPTGILIEQILNGELDLALVSDPPTDERYISKTIFKEKLVLVSDNRHPNIRTPQDLGNFPTLLAFSSRCRYRSVLSDWLNTESVTAKLVEINSYHALLTCVTAGMGVGIAPQAVIDIYPFAEAIKTHNLPRELRNSQTCLIWRTGTSKGSIDAFVDCMLSFR